MQQRINFTLFPVLLGAVVLAFTFILWPSAEANAQCGSQASSCKNCHEVQGQDPVNTDGTGWHQSHSFGDFCYLCHAGNSQSMDQAEAHASMVPPLSDVEAACQSCHPTDLMEKAGVYAAALGVEIGEGSPEAPPGSATEATDPQPPVSEPAAEDPPQIVAPADQILDYEAQYAETVLGQRQVNWGNLILLALIGVVAVGGGAFVYRNERKLRGYAPAFRGEKKIADRVPEAGVAAVPGVEDLPVEIRELLPKLLQLNPVGLHGLKRLLQNPEEANQLLHHLSRVDPDLIRQLRGLDREARALLLAMAEN
jgi:hypothetical protein